MKALLWLPALLLLAGCSGAELAYRNADWLIVSYADDLVDLRDAQAERWEPLVTEAMATHRRQELPTVKDFICHGDPGGIYEDYE